MKRTVTRWEAQQLVAEYMKQLRQAMLDAAQAAAEDQLFWDDIGYAFADPRDRDARKALDRIGKLVHLQREHVKQLATQSDRLRREAGQKGTSTVEERRRLIQEAILLSL